MKYIGTYSDNQDIVTKEKIKNGVELKENIVSIPSVDCWRSVTYGNNKFVAVGDAHTAYSTDGINWIDSDSTALLNPMDVVYGGGKFVAVGNYSFSKNAYSIDGINWTTIDSIILHGSNRIAYGNGRFVATQAYDGFAYSDDGINWSMTGGKGSITWGAITYGNGKFVAIGLKYGSDSAYSTDGINWTKITLPTKAIYQSITYGNGKFVAVGNNSTVVYSTNGIDWTQATFGGGVGLFSVIYADNKFVATGLVSAYSIDGVNWIIDWDTKLYDYYPIAYGNGKFVAVGNNSYKNKIIYSIDGINWTNTILALQYPDGTDITEDVKNLIDVPSASATTPRAPGTANAGSENAYARGDHVHPSEVFIATYGKTTINEIDKAAQASKIIITIYNKIVCQLSNSSPDNIMFVGIGSTGMITYLYVNKSGWSVMENPISMGAKTYYTSLKIDDWTINDDNWAQQKIALDDTIFNVWNGDALPIIKIDLSDVSDQTEAMHLLESWNQYYQGITIVSPESDEDEFILIKMPQDPDSSTANMPISITFIN